MQILSSDVCSLPEGLFFFREYLRFLIISKPLQTAKYEVSLENQVFVFFWQFSSTKLGKIKRSF